MFLLEMLSLLGPRLGYQDHSATVYEDNQSAYTLVNMLHELFHDFWNHVRRTPQAQEESVWAQSRPTHENMVFCEQFC